MSVYFFYGDEDYNIELEIKKLRSKLLDKNFSDMNFKSVSNPNFADLITLLRTQPMMFGNQMIVINCENYFTTTFDDKQIKEIETALESNSSELYIIFCAQLPRNEGKKIDSRKKIYKLLTKYAQVQEFPTFKAYKVQEIITWLTKESKKLDIILEKDAATALVEQIGNNLREFVNELQKLKLLAYPQKNITKAMVKEICISNEDVFAIAEHLQSNDKAKALLEFQKLLDKQHYLGILSALQTMLRQWIIIKLNYTSKSPTELSRMVNMHEYRVKLAYQNMKNTPLKLLVDLRENLTKADYNIKTGRAINPILELEKAILTA